MHFELSLRVWAHGLVAQLSNEQHSKLPGALRLRQAPVKAIRHRALGGFEIDMSVIGLPFGGHVGSPGLVCRIMQRPNLLLNTDSYKASHWLQYPPGTDATFFYVESRGGVYDRTLF